MSDPDYTGALAEFAALRTEMDSRVKYQQQILALQLTLTSAIFAFGLTKPAPVGILLIVPLSSYLLAGRYVGQRTAVRWIGKYIDDQLSPRVPDGLGWVRWSAEHRRPERLLDWFVPLLICFPGAGSLALGWTFRLLIPPTGRSAWATVGVALTWVLGAFAVGMSAYLFTRVYRDQSPRAVELNESGRSGALGTEDQYEPGARAMTFPGDIDAPG